MDYLEPHADKVILILNEFRIHSYEFKSEDELEKILVPYLKEKIADHKIHIITQSKFREERVLIPDIVIGEHAILIELKCLNDSINDIYRLFYQAIKYSKLAKERVILFTYDPNYIFAKEDILDLENITNVKVIHKN